MENSKLKIGPRLEIVTRRMVYLRKELEILETEQKLLSELHDIYKLSESDIIDDERALFEKVSRPLQIKQLNEGSMINIIYKQMQQHTKLTISQLREYTGFNSKQISNNLLALKKKNKIKKGDTYGVWELVG